MTKRADDESSPVEEQDAGALGPGSSPENPDASEESTEARDSVESLDSYPPEEIQEYEEVYKPFILSSIPPPVPVEAGPRRSLIPVVEITDSDSEPPPPASESYSPLAFESFTALSPYYEERSEDSVDPALLDEIGLRLNPDLLPSLSPPPLAAAPVTARSWAAPAALLGASCAMGLAALALWTMRGQTGLPQVASRPSAAVASRAAEPTGSQPSAVAVQVKPSAPEPAIVAAPGTQEPGKNEAVNPLTPVAAQPPVAVEQRPAAAHQPREPGKAGAKADVPAATGKATAASGGPSASVPAGEASGGSGKGQETAAQTAAGAAPQAASAAIPPDPFWGEQTEPAVGNQELTREQVYGVMSRLRHAVEACSHGKHGIAQIYLTVDGSGKVLRAVMQEGVFRGTAEGSCMTTLVRNARFPAFSGAPVSVLFPFSL